MTRFLCACLLLHLNSITPTLQQIPRTFMVSVRDFHRNFPRPYCELSACIDTDCGEVSVKVVVMEFGL